MSHEMADEFAIPSGKTEEDISKAKNIDGIVAELTSNQPKVISFLRKKGVSENIAGDIAQEAFIRAQKAAPEFRRGSSVFTWQCSIAWKFYLQTIGSKKNRSDLHQEFNEKILEGSINDRFDVSGISTSPQEQLISKEETARIQAAINKLPDKFKQIMKLHIDGKSNQEIADILQIPPGSVRSRKHWARKELSGILDLNEINRIK